MRFLAFLLATSVCLAAAPNDVSGSGVDVSSSEIIHRYVEASHAQGSQLRGVKMNIDIEAQLPKLKRQGKFHALRIIPRVGKITYDVLRYEGDKTIKTDVIARYLAAEDQALAGDPALLEITPKNYKFNYKRRDTLGDRAAYVFQLSPKKKRVGLFKGELWIDANTYLPLREIGRFVKSPSVFLKRVEFVRDFDIRDGVAVPTRILSQVDTRIVGPAEISVDFSNIQSEEEASASPVPSGELPQD